MATPYITIGCPTTGGGQVISGNSLFLIDGIAVACVGDKATCPTHKIVATIVSGDPNMQIFGKAAARVNDSLSCGCKLLPKQNLVVQDNSGGGASSAAKSSQALMSQKQPATDSFVKDEYESYYIENTKTEIVKFKNLLFPYDQDKANLFGSAVQALSGACSFEITHKIQKRQLFITVTLLPPALRADATIYTFGSIRLLKNKQPIGGPFALKVGKGFWNTENDRQPVGSCEIILPPPDLQTITVSLELGFEGKFDNGKVVPNPPYKTHTFTITSASRRKA
ncbi:PAAR domain-containing protein [Acinetobacter baumannii]|uniref:PAAR domain-containing protein n=1 Tax=Acinetobacter baumannii TaxID=470 RepID=UPI000B8CEA8A|nr:PAAR domain-containing protein [Acinetobacter baumannii]MCJ9007438.1 PAAR domain-containing protein [Acinetobacter baumannii]MCJ9366747.1 PAAR domain-containing protein [Acinetobacter baumannii]MCJ9400275.1 PAAR domain-containing protein [Acinetobacter baumannii]MCJ9462004.1 PAAR domain-containing protein [Acinetobacter baumannii]MDP7720250.1 PAAR domain-containing protein [Acinetobacter baumannii]